MYTYITPKGNFQLIPIHPLQLYIMKKTLLLFIALLPLCITAQNTADKSEPSIKVTGKAELEVEPDWILLSMRAKETEHIKKESEMINMEDSILTFIVSLGLDSASFMVDKYATNKRSSYSSTSKYKLRKSYLLKINNIKVADTIIMKCMQVGMSNLYVQKVGHSKLDSLKNQALIKALNNAQAKAATIAATMNVKLGKVLFVDETGNTSGTEYYPRHASYSKADARIFSSESFNKSSSAGFKKIKIVKRVVVFYGIEQ